MHVVDGAAGKQAPHHASPAGEAPVQSDAQSATKTAAQTAAQTLRRLLSDREAARVLGVGDRTFAELIANANWLPTPIVFGPRLRRWDADELLQAARTKAPRGAKGAEPAQLRRARIERMNATGNAGAVA